MQRLVAATKMLPSVPDRVDPRQFREAALTDYPIRLHLRYDLATGLKCSHSGEAWTVSLSRSAIVLESVESLPMETEVTLWIDWPVPLEKRIALTLAVQGRTFRAQGQRTAVKIFRHEFRLRPAARCMSA